ncbi:MAG: hypothetical protein Q4P24_17365 [Rhodobacterales bacterium]|nr:hypothetical protein [Rhodobacterales bacterium]
MPYRFDGYALVLESPRGEERHFLARLEASDPDLRDEVVVNGRIFWPTDGANDK